MVESPSRRFYLGIGAPRSGTTWLYKNIRASTDLYLPPLKELRFFHGSRTPRERAGHLKSVLQKANLNNIDRQFIEAWRNTRDGDGPAYVGMFPSTGDIGEISPIYSIMERKGIAALHQHLNGFDMRVFYMLRNPFFRDLSHVIFTMHRQKKRAEPYSESAYRKFIETENFIHRSDYGRNIRAWRKVFRSDLHLFYYDELALAPKKFFHRFCARLDLGYDKQKLTKLGRNKSGRARAFANTLPPAIEEALRRRAEQQIKAGPLIAHQYQDKWRQELELYFQNPPTD